MYEDTSHVPAPVSRPLFVGEVFRYVEGWVLEIRTGLLAVLLGDEYVDKCQEAAYSVELAGICITLMSKACEDAWLGAGTVRDETDNDAVFRLEHKVAGVFGYALPTHVPFVDALLLLRPPWRDALAYASAIALSCDFKHARSCDRKASPITIALAIVLLRRHGNFKDLFCDAGMDGN